MRFQYRGLHRENANPVAGYLEAPDADTAYQLLSDRGIVTEALEGAPDLADDGPMGTPDVSLFANALEEALDSALESSSARVSFDTLSKRYRGKKVRVIDRDEIRYRVARVVDSTLAASEANRESGATARERVAEAIGGLFTDPRKTAPKDNPQPVAKTGGADAVATMTDAGLAQQIGRLSGVVEQAEGLIAAMQAALRNADTGAAPRRRVAFAAPTFTGEQNEVLKEILQSNLDLRREIMNGMSNKSTQEQRH